MANNNDLFGFSGVQSTPQAPVRTRPAPKPAPKKPTKKPVVTEPEGPKPTERVKTEAEKEEAPHSGEDVVLQNVEAACHGNRYLEAMILGEILNTPRFRR